MNTHIVAARLMAAAVLAGASGLTTAGTIIGGSAILTAGYANQLENWLGQGELTLTNIFTRQIGDDSLDFHAAVDGKGPTFVVLEGTDPDDATGFAYTGIVGGFNPVSWDSSTGFHLDPNVADRTAFIFNLTTGTKLTQRTSPYTNGPDSGIYQTSNLASYGPTFGGGADLYVDATLAHGFSYLYSYDPSNVQVNPGQSLFGGRFLGYGQADVTYRALEVFAVDLKSVPEPASIALIALGLALAARIRFRTSV